MAKLNINGASLELIEKGKGETIVFVHGSASDYRTWQAQMDTFGKSHRVIAYSRRYHWPNEHILETADYSMAEHVDDLQRLIQLLNVSPVHLFGHSYGAFLCLLLAMRNPELVRTLVLAEPPAITLFVSSKPKPLEILRLFFQRPGTATAVMKFGIMGVAPATAAVNKGDMEKTMRIFGISTLGRATYENLSESRLEQVRANLIKAELTGSGFAPIDNAQLNEIRIPVLLLNGEKSPKLYHHILNRIEELLPDAQRIIIPDASHIMHEDNPSAFNKAVLSFLKEHRGEQAG